MKLSENFYLSEFTTSAGIRIKPTEQQIFCLKVLCTNILQPIRNKFGSIVIKSGLRNIKSYKKLIKQGYPASKTSDHFGWSDINPKGTGAADIFCQDVDSMEKVFQWIIRNLNDECKQIIFYPDMNVVHISNKFDKIFVMNDTMSKDKTVLIKTKNSGFVPYTNF